jgi:CO/xanthine dehydrogenase FAD-binding subunit
MVSSFIPNAYKTFEYKKPYSLSEARIFLKGNPGCVKVLAGGTDLNLLIRRGVVSPLNVVDVKNIPELNVLEVTDKGILHIGAAVPFEKILAFPGLLPDFALLAQACAVVGSVQIRNRGSMGGNICNAAPSADSAPVLMCLDARLKITSSKKTRTVNINRFFTGPGKTVIEPDELLVSIEVPKPSSPYVGCYMRHTLREEMDITVAGVSAFITASPGGKTIKEARIVLGAVAPTPLRASAAEALLKGKTLTAELIDEVAETAAQEAKPISDVRASADYRRELLRVLVRRTLRNCSRNLKLNYK